MVIAQSASKWKDRFEALENKQLKGLSHKSSFKSTRNLLSRKKMPCSIVTLIKGWLVYKGSVGLKGKFWDEVWWI